MIDPLGDSEFGFLLEVSTEKERERESSLRFKKEISKSR